MGSTRITGLAILAAVLLALAPLASAQAPPGPIPTKPGAEPERQPTAEEAKRTIHVRVNEVTAPVTVRNASGEMLLDFPRESFHIFDNGVGEKVGNSDL